MFGKRPSATDAPAPRPAPPPAADGAAIATRPQRVEPGAAGPAAAPVQTPPPAGKPAAGPKPTMAFEQLRAAQAAAPAFPTGTVADVAFSQTGAPDGKAAEGVTVSFPPALANPAARPYDYEVRLETRQADVELVVSAHRVYSPSAALPRRHDAEVKAASCVFVRTDLPKSGEYRFAVVPLDSYGVKGSAVYSPWALSPAEKKR